MRGAILRGADRVSMCILPDPKVTEPTDVVVRMVMAAICEADVRACQGVTGSANGLRCGHEFVGVVADVGSDVGSMRRGDLVVAPFAFSDGTCADCRSGRPAACPAGGVFGVAAGGGLAEGVRVPFGEATLVTVPMRERDERLPSVLALGDVMAVGHHAVRSAGVRRGSIVAVMNDDASGLCAVLAARSAGADRIILVTTCENRAAIGVKFGATGVVEPYGDESAQLIRELTDGAGADVVIDCAGGEQSLETALAACRDGGAVSVGAGGHSGGDGVADSRRTVTITSGPAPARTYLPSLLGQVLAGQLDPSPVFDCLVPLSMVGLGYEAMRTRAAVKVLVKP